MIAVGSTHRQRVLHDQSIGIAYRFHARFFARYRLCSNEIVSGRRGVRSPPCVIPAQAGIHCYHRILWRLDREAIKRIRYETCTRDGCI